MKNSEKESTLQIKLFDSLTCRITVYFTVLFLVAGVFLLCLFTVIRLKSISDVYREAAKEFAYHLENKAEGIESIHEECTSLVVRSVENKEVIYRLGKEMNRFSIGKWHFEKQGGKMRLYARYVVPLVFYKTECSAEFVFDCTEDWKQVKAELIRFAEWELVFVVFAAFACYILVRAMFRPIDEMSAQVGRLNLQNIHTERLSVEGTMDELKTLASGINEMLDRMEQAYEAQKQFVSEASHELRTPITVLQGYSAMLRRWGAEDREVLAESVEAIESEAKSMQELVEKLLFLSRHERRKLPFAKEWFDMAEVVRELEKEMVYLSDTRNMQCPVCESARVYGDRQALKQAIRVFLDNAVKYTREGDAIALSCRNRHGACEITVEDTGLGMKKEDMEGIFGRFFRADTVRGKNIEGHGLGLSIARLIIDGHAGKILVRSQYTKGSAFIVSIPRQRGV